MARVGIEIYLNCIRVGQEAAQMLPESCHICRHLFSSCLRLTFLVRVKLLLFNKQWMLFALTYLWELHLDRNVLLSLVRLIICPIVCACSFPLCLRKVTEDFSAAAWLWVPGNAQRHHWWKKTCLYVLLVTTFKSSISHLRTSSSSSMKNERVNCYSSLRRFLFYESQIQWCVTKP